MRAVVAQIEAARSVRRDVTQGRIPHMVSALVVALLAADPAPTPVVKAAQAPAYRIADGNGLAVLLHNATTGSTDVSVGLLELEPGAAVPEHKHDGAEHLVVLSGEAQLVLEKKTLTVGEGDAVFIPKGAAHSARVAADAKAPFKAVQVYAPAGAEQRFTKGTKVR